jgi:alkylation response protein AidB-like acyl-CoA dehydrogenase
MDVVGLDSLTWFNQPGAVSALAAHVPQAFAYLRATTIYGGTNEIQKNIIAKYILGLPSR